MAGSTMDLAQPTIELVTTLGARASVCDPDAVCSPQGGPAECMPDTDPYQDDDDEDEDEDD